MIRFIAAPTGMREAGGFPPFLINPLHIVNHQPKSSQPLLRIFWRKTLISSCCVLGLIQFTLHAAEPATRGIWWWTKADQPWGTEQVIGDEVKEASVVAFAQKWRIGRFYCCLGRPTLAKPALIRAWNERVHAAGLTSQLLFGENTWIYPDKRKNLLNEHILPALIEFNAASTKPQQRFDGLHLDVEPQGLPGWRTSTRAQRKDLLLLLRDTFRDVRAFLDAHDAKDVPVYADLPVWFDQLDKPVGWASEAERDAWFADLGQSLAGVSVMAYERNTFARIEDGVGWEVQHFKGEVRIGLEASIGPEKERTWKTLDEFLAMIAAEERVQPTRLVDVHAFAQFHDHAEGSAPTNH